MCGRYVIYDQLTKGGAELLGHTIPANFNIAPTASAPIIRLNKQTKEQELIIARWGLVPNWAKSLKIPPFFNARADNLNANKVFWPSINQRCLVPMAGFYEWSEHDKQPFYIHLDANKPFYVAGLWNRWVGVNDAPIDSFSIITTKPNQTLADIHHRMPVILASSDHHTWLDQPYEHAKALLQPSTQAMRKYKVNNARNNSAQCLEPF